MAVPSSFALFSQHFSSSPKWLIESPGRINLIGEHIDYLDGFVMPAAISRQVSMLVAPNALDRIRVWTSFLEAQAPLEVVLHDLKPVRGGDSWLNYVVGVIEMLRREGVVLSGFDAVITSDLPSGAGLSSSAALETATALAMESVTGVRLDPVRRAQLCQKAEHEFANVPCGIMDQMAVGLGQENKALLIDCRDESFQSVEIPEGIAILVSDTQVTHALGDGEYRKRRESCEEALAKLNRPSWRDVVEEDLNTAQTDLGELLFRRSRHVISEMGRVSAMREALESGDSQSVASIMRSGHESLRHDFEVSCPELDCLVDAAYEFGIERGLVGARMTGGGFGGSTVTLVRDSAALAMQRHLENAFEASFSRKPNCFITRASPGARANPVESIT